MAMDPHKHCRNLPSLRGDNSSPISNAVGLKGHLQASLNTMTE